MSAVFHFDVSVLRRKHERNFVQLAAYLIGIRLMNRKKHRTFARRSREDVIGWELVGTRLSVEDFANRTELAETRKNATVGRQIVVALPRGMTTEELVELLRAFSIYLSALLQVPVLFALHRSRSESKAPGNPHGHLLFGGRSWDELSQSFARHRIAGLYERYGQGPKLFEDMRQKWEELVNARLPPSTPPISRLSHARRGIARTPRRHLGPGATAYERRTGKLSRSGEFNAWIDELDAQDLAFQANEAEITAIEQALLVAEEDLVVAPPPIKADATEDTQTPAVLPPAVESGFATVLPLPAVSTHPATPIERVAAPPSVPSLETSLGSEPRMPPDATQSALDSASCDVTDTPENLVHRPMAAARLEEGETNRSHAVSTAPSEQLPTSESPVGSDEAGKEIMAADAASVLSPLQRRPAPSQGVESPASAIFYQRNTVQGHPIEDKTPIAQLAKDMPPVPSSGVDEIAALLSPHRLRPSRPRLGRKPADLEAGGLAPGGAVGGMVEQFNGVPSPDLAVDSKRIVALVAEAESALVRPASKDVAARRPTTAAILPVRGDAEADLTPTHGPSSGGKPPRLLGVAEAEIEALLTPPHPASPAGGPDSRDLLQRRSLDLNPP